MSLPELQNQMASLLFEGDTEKSFGKFVKYLDENGYSTDYIDADGWRMTHLLMMKLRFERLLNAIPSMRELFEQDSEKFMKTFNEWHHQCPSDTFFPQEEIEKFMDFYQNRH